MNQKTEDSAKNRRFSRVGRNKRHKLTAMLRDKNISKIEKRSCQLYASRTTKLRTQMSPSSTEQSQQNGPISALEKVRAQSANLKSACNVHLKI